MLVTLGRKRRS